MAVLRRLSIAGAVLVRSDAGSDFTSEVFQQGCARHGAWVRCKVSQVGGMGVLERLNRTYKHQFAFRHDWQSLAEVQAALPEFHRWYNHERRHSALGYTTPWIRLTQTAAARGRRLKSNLEHYLLVGKNQGLLEAGR